MLAFPANNFGEQEPGTNSEIKKFCSGKGVSFPLFAKISVKGDDVHPLYAYLTEKSGGPPKWNFHKYLVGHDGRFIEAVEPKGDPMSEEVQASVKKALEARDAAKKKRAEARKKRGNKKRQEKKENAAKE